MTALAARRSSPHLRPRISVIVPCRNEAGHIEDFLRCLRNQRLPTRFWLEILIADGSSDDGTREIVKAWQSRWPELRLLDNPGRIVSTGLNRAIRDARGSIIVRMDVHTTYAGDYIAQCVLTLERSGAANVGGPARTIASGYIQKAVSAAYHSPFFVGGAKFHDIGYEGPVDTLPYGCWRRETLLEAGLFAEDLVRAQDCELNFRIRMRGGTLWQTPRIRSWYKPRSSLRALARQYHQYGYWKCRAALKHGRLPSARQGVPGALLAVWALLLLGSLVDDSTVWAAAVLAGLYGAANLAASLQACHRRQRGTLLPVVPLVFAVVHLSWGCGFVAGILQRVLGSWTCRRSSRALPWVRTARTNG